MSKAQRRFAYQGAGSGTQQHCHLSTGIRVLGFPLYSERAFDFYFLFGVLRISGYQPPNQGNRKLGHTLTPHYLLIATGSGVEILDCIFGRGRNCRNIGWPLLLFSLVWLSSFHYFFFCLSPLRLTIRGTCSNALQPGKKGPGQKLWIPNSSSLFGFSRRHKRLFLDDTPMRDVVCVHHFNNTILWTWLFLFSFSHVRFHDLG